VLCGRRAEARGGRVRVVVGACDENEMKRNPQAATQAQPRDAELSSPGIYSNENRQEAVVVF